jgi:hypothetical protein
MDDEKSRQQKGSIDYEREMAPIGQEMAFIEAIFL